MYTIVDIESTGGKSEEDKITEIAIIRFDGINIVDKFCTLVNPEKEIDIFVQKLTGITDKMLVTAPKFHEVAKRIIEITEDSIFIAHNVSFDYRILRKEFRSLGYGFNKKTLCTVELSKQLLPEIESYKLSKLTESLGIPMVKKHRALYDTEAALEVFKILLEKDKNKQIISAYLEHNPMNKMSFSFLNIIEEMPTQLGVFYIFNSQNEIIYIDSSKNIRKKVRELLTSSLEKAVLIQKEISRVEFSLCGTECLMQLKERCERNSMKPSIKKKKKVKKLSWGLRVDWINEVQFIFIERINASQNYFLKFTSLSAIKQKIKLWKEKYDLENNNFRLFDKAFGNDEMNEEKCKVQNENINALVKDYRFPFSSGLFIDRGRKIGEKSFIYIKNKRVVGYGYFTLNIQIDTISKIENLCTFIPQEEQNDLIVLNYMNKPSKKQIIDLDP